MQILRVIVMTKIILGYEKFNFSTNSEWNYNGRIEPSTIEASAEELERMDPFMRNYYNFCFRPDIESEKWLMWSSVNPKCQQQDFERKIISDISPTQKYIYGIEIQVMSIFVHYNSHIAISERVLDDARKGLAHIVFIHIFEGNMKNYKDQFNNLILKLNIPKSNVHMIHGDFNVGTFKDASFTYHPANVFTWWMYNFKQLCVDENKFHPNKLFNCYNRRLRRHRATIMGLLYRADLLKNSIYSFGMPSHMKVSSYNNLENELTSNEIEFLNSIIGTSPDEKNLDTENPAQDINLPHYESTFLSLVSETLADDYLFFSEKTYKPILVKHPFILFAGTNQLMKLKEFGFKTFDKWWDESYDSEPSVVNKCKKIINILLELNQLSTEQLKTMREEMLPILDHNRNLLLEILNEDQHGYLDNFYVYKIIKNILG